MVTGTKNEIGTHYIYALHDPRDDSPRYVGKTKHLSHRLRRHMANPSSGGMRRWISELAEIGQTPRMVIIEVCEGDLWIERERFHVADYRDRFSGLLNVLSGGGGPLDKHYTQEIRQKIGASLRGKKRSPEQIAKMKERKFSPEHRAKISAAGRGRKKSPEHIAKLRGRKLTPEHIAKIKAANLGRKNTPQQLENFRGKKTPEHIAKMRAALTGRNLSPEHVAKLRARKWSIEERIKMSAARKGCKHSQETRAKIGLAGLGRKHRPESLAKMRAKRLTPEQLAKMRSIRPSPEARANMSAGQRRRQQNVKAMLSAKSESLPFIQWDLFR